LESEETLVPVRDSTWPRPLKELEKEKAKTPAKPLPKPDSRPTPVAQALLNQEQQKKKKQKQQQQQQQHTSEKQHKEQHPKQTPGASPQPKPTQGATGTTPTTSDKQVAGSKKIPAAPSAIRFSQALSNPRPPGNDKLESAKQFIEAWNDADLAKDFSTSAPHPAGPSRMFQSLHSVQTSVTEANRVFEVTLPNLAFT
jgi:DNA segregation ATPase FtsK/SpoIIIE-like protein